MSVIELEIKPTKTLCPSCGSFFDYRSNKQYCSSKCRKKANRQSAKLDENITKTESRRQHELFNLNDVLSHKLYTTPPMERYGYMESIIKLAREANGGLLRALLMNTEFIYPNKAKTKFFYLRLPKAYKSFPQAVNHYTLNSPHHCYSIDYIKGKSVEPPTGEVMADGTTDAPEDAIGWLPPMVGYKRRGVKQKRSTKFVEDKAGMYIHPWYYDGATHRQGAIDALNEIYSGKKRLVTMYTENKAA